MLINIKVKPNSPKRSIESFGNNRYLVYLKEPPENNRANMELINFLSKEFGTPVSMIKIKSGRNSHNKVVEIQKSLKKQGIFGDRNSKKKLKGISV